MHKIIINIIESTYFKIFLAVEAILSFILIIMSLLERFKTYNLTKIDNKLTHFLSKSGNFGWFSLSLIMMFLYAAIIFSLISMPLINPYLDSEDDSIYAGLKAIIIVSSILIVGLGITLPISKYIIIPFYEKSLTKLENGSANILNITIVLIMVIFSILFFIVGLVGILSK